MWHEQKTWSIQKSGRLSTTVTIENVPYAVKKHLSIEDMCISLIVPKSKGGYKDFANMQCTCEPCCKMKHDLTQEEFFKKIFGLAVHNRKGILGAYAKRKNK